MHNSRRLEEDNCRCSMWVIGLWRRFPETWLSVVHCTAANVLPVWHNEGDNRPIFDVQAIGPAADPCAGDTDNQPAVINPHYFPPDHRLARIYTLGFKTSRRWAQRQKGAKFIFHKVV